MHFPAGNAPQAEVNDTPHHPRLVLDTNTIMALWHFRDPALAALAAAIESGGLALVARDDTLEELRRVLAYPRFGIAPEQQRRVLDAYRARISLAPPPTDDAPPLPQCRDRDDQKFLETARDANANGLITRDKALLRLARHSLIRTRFAIQTPEHYCTAMENSGPSR